MTLLAPLLGALLSSCGSSRYADTYPLSSTIFRINRGGVSGLIPEGWTAIGARAGEDSTAALTLALGDSLRIVFRPVDLDSSASAYFSRHGMTDLAALTRTLHDSSAGTTRRGIDRFSSGGREFASYEVESEGKRMRVVVFAAGGNYFECEAWPVRPPDGGGPGSYERLFSAQETVLRSLR